MGGAKWSALQSRKLYNLKLQTSIKGIFPLFTLTLRSSHLISLKRRELSPVPKARFARLGSGKAPPVQVGQVLVGHGVVGVRHLVVGPDEGAVAHCGALLDAVVLAVVKVPRRRNPKVKLNEYHQI